MIPRSEPGEFARRAGVLALLWLTGCTSLHSGGTTATARSETPASERPRSVAQASPFGDPPSETSVAARPEAAERTVKPTAWSKLKNAIGRSNPQAIPLPSEPESDAEERPFVTIDGRDF